MIQNDHVYLLTLIIGKLLIYICNFLVWCVPSTADFKKHSDVSPWPDIEFEPFCKLADAWWVSELQRDYLLGEAEDLGEIGT